MPADLVMAKYNCSVLVRPSGTEPKLKTYISVSTDYKEEAEKLEEKIVGHMQVFIFKILNKCIANKGVS